MSILRKILYLANMFMPIHVHVCTNVHARSFLPCSICTQEVRGHQKKEILLLDLGRFTLLVTNTYI